MTVLAAMLILNLLYSIGIVIIIIEDIHGRVIKIQNIVSYKRRELFADLKPVLSPFGGHKKRITPNKKERTVMTKENRQNLADMDRGSYYNQEESLEESLEDIEVFYNDSDSDSETYDNESSSDGDDEQGRSVKVSVIVVM